MRRPRVGATVHVCADQHRQRGRQRQHLRGHPEPMSHQRLRQLRRIGTRGVASVFVAMVFAAASAGVATADNSNSNSNSNSQSQSQSQSQGGDEGGGGGGGGNSWPPTGGDSWPPNAGDGGGADGGGAKSPTSKPIVMPSGQPVSPAT